MDHHNNETNEVQPRRRVRWNAAFKAGLIAGVIFLVLSRGIPWFSSGLVSPTVMGREIRPSPEFSASTAMAIAFLHVIVSIAYALLLAPLIHRLNFGKAVFCGALLGTGLYFLNFLIYSQFFPARGGLHELAPIITHIAFGMVAAAAYKGLAKPKVKEAA